MSDHETSVAEACESLSETLKPFQQTLNQRQRMAEFIKQCIKCVEKDDFLQLDELLRSPLAQTVREEEGLDACAPRLDQLLEYAESKVKQYRADFIADLKVRAQEADLPVQVDFPHFVFLKGVEGSVDFQGRRTTVNKKTLKSIDPRKIVAAALSLKKQLYDRPFDPQAFVNDLFTVYATIVKRSGSGIGDTVPIQQFYLEYVLSLQSKPFFGDMEKGRFRGYGLDQFSVDLWRYFRAGTGGTSGGFALQLKPGRNNSLWLFDPEGEKRLITHISFQENR